MDQLRISRVLKAVDRREMSYVEGVCKCVDEYVSDYDEPSEAIYSAAHRWAGQVVGDHRLPLKTYRGGYPRR